MKLKHVYGKRVVLKYVYSEHANTALDCNFNDPRPELDRSYWYLKLV